MWLASRPIMSMCVVGVVQVADVAVVVDHDGLILVNTKARQWKFWPCRKRASQWDCREVWSNNKLRSVEMEDWKSCMPSIHWSPSRAAKKWVRLGTCWLVRNYYSLSSAARPATMIIIIIIMKTMTLLFLTNGTILDTSRTGTGSESESKSNTGNGNEQVESHLEPSWLAGRKIMMMTNGDPITAYDESESSWLMILNFHEWAIQLLSSSAGTGNERILACICRDDETLTWLVCYFGSLHW